MPAPQDPPPAWVVRPVDEVVECYRVLDRRLGLGIDQRDLGVLGVLGCHVEDQARMRSVGGRPGGRHGAETRSSPLTTGGSASDNQLSSTAPSSTGAAGIQVGTVMHAVPSIRSGSQ